MNVLAIARFTLAEAVSRRLILAGLLLSGAFVGLFALGFTFLYDRVAEDPEAMVEVFAASVMTTLGLYAVHFLAGFLALFLSVGAVSAEIDSGTLHAVLARPLRRAHWLLGRWLALTGLVVVYVTVMAGALLLVARAVAGFTVPSPLPAVALMALEGVVLLTLSLLGSTRLSTLANGVVVFSLFGLAWLAGIIEYVGDLVTNTAMVNLGIAVSLLLPADALWRGASYYVQAPEVLTASQTGGGLPFAATAPPAAALVVWGLVYPLVMLGAALAAFARRDL